MEKRAQIILSGFKWGLRTVSHPDAYLILKDSNVVEITLHIEKTGLQFYSQLLDNATMAETKGVTEIIQHGNTVKLTVCVPEKEKDYKVYIFARESADQKFEYMLGYGFNVDANATMQEVSFPTYYPDMANYGAELISPKHVKMHVGQTYNFRIKFPFEDLMSVLILPDKKFKSLGCGEYELDFTPTAAGKVLMYACKKTETQAKGLLQMVVFE
ncbi:predicted protein [Naegleria gruberi]|uniref:Predicted protein n=1 Tax=Naegleria gruberi TaxID=5762 RepID=D2VF44_NAEGR|nr:uncharacterized protein NAEGRDRAFT_67495 [Naegleria gruberi]EFC44618.1 predicted protein [Naegleria gruberi]|eukprot:XP_002677362.1 predicted protein [Naegleria gruberi strain NEG-M]